MMRFLVVDDHPLFREIVEQQLLSAYPQARIYQAKDGNEAMGLIRQPLIFDLILLDIAMPGHDGEALLPEFRISCKNTPIVFLSSMDSPERAEKLVESGANGFISKTSAPAEFAQAIRLILLGETYVSPSILAAKHELEHETALGGDSPQLLTKKQHEVLALLSQGLPNKSIAKQLCCSEGTVKLHVGAILRALKVRNRTEAVSEAQRIGLIGAMGIL